MSATSIVWAKQPGFPSWPAQVSELSIDKATVVFYGYESVATLDANAVAPFVPGDLTDSRFQLPKKGSLHSRFKQAIELATKAFAEEAADAEAEVNPDPDADAAVCVLATTQNPECFVLQCGGQCETGVDDARLASAFNSSQLSRATCAKHYGGKRVLPFECRGRAISVVRDPELRRVLEVVC